ncbi:MAG TPA: hypothetical protein VLZ05_04615 [Mycobacterium sp.]|nr:hypothetical protein [Mycobacterium sp.]
MHALKVRSAAARVGAAGGVDIVHDHTTVDFQRLRRSTVLDFAPLIAASICLDALKVFWFCPQLFSRNRD